MASWTRQVSCPLTGCGWAVGPLVSGNPRKPVRPEDSAVTQYSELVEHLLNEHEAKIGG